MDDTETIMEIPLARRVGEEERVLAWRESELIRAGFKPNDAFELAIRADVDLHLAVDLLKRGCSPPTALRTLL